MRPRRKWHVNLRGQGHLLAILAVEHPPVPLLGHDLTSVVAVAVRSGWVPRCHASPVIA